MAWLGNRGACARARRRSRRRGRAAAEDGRRAPRGDDRRAALARSALDDRGDHPADHLARLRDPLHLRPELHAGADARRGPHGRRRRPALHDPTAPWRPLPQRQGDDVRGRRRLAQPLGAHGGDRQGHLQERRGRGGEGPVHGRHPHEVALGRAPRRARAAEQRRRDLPEGGLRRGRRRAAEGGHRHGPLPLRRAQAGPPYQAGALQGLRGSDGSARRLRRPADRVRGRDPLHPGARRRGAARRG